MELVVNIPDEMYEQIKESDTIFRDDERTCYEAVKNGVPLHSHGRLKDGYAEKKNPDPYLE